MIIPRDRRNHDSRWRTFADLFHLLSVKLQTILTTPNLTRPRRTLIRAGFERDNVGYKSGLDTSDYWCARGHYYLRHSTRWYSGSLVRIYEAILSLAVTQPTNKSCDTLQINKCGMVLAYSRCSRSFCHKKV